MSRRPRALDPNRWHPLTILVLDIFAAVALGIVIAYQVRPF